MKFSVIIPVRGITDYLKENVSYLKKVRYYDFEVIIVADEQINVNFGKKEDRFKLIASGSGKPSLKRNLGAKAATGDVLAFLDDDAYPDSHWLRAAANIFEEEPDLYALGGPALTPENIGFEEKMSGRLIESNLVSGGTSFRHKKDKRKEIDDYPSVNLFVKKQAFMAVGGYDEETYPGEDTKLCLDLMNMYGKKFLYDPGPVVYHHRREVFEPYLKQISRFGRYRGWFARKFPKNSRKLQFFLPSLFLLGLLFGLPASIVFSKLLPYFMLTIFMYFVLVFAESQKVSILEKDPNAFKIMFQGIIKTHFVYGWNFIKGFMKRPKLELREVDTQTGNYETG